MQQENFERVIQSPEDKIKLTKIALRGVAIGLIIALVRGFTSASGSSDVVAGSEEQTVAILHRLTERDRGSAIVLVLSTKANLSPLGLRRNCSIFRGNQRSNSHPTSLRTAPTFSVQQMMFCVRSPLFDPVTNGTF
jgi:hypothetical protein